MHPNLQAVDQMKVTTEQGEQGVLRIRRVLSSDDDPTILKDAVVVHYNVVLSGGTVAFAGRATLRKETVESMARLTSAMQQAVSHPGETIYL